MEENLEPQEDTQVEESSEEKAPQFKYKEGATEEEMRKTAEKRYTDFQSLNDKRYKELNEALQSIGTRLTSLDKYDEQLNKLSDNFGGLKKMLDPNELKEPLRPDSDDPDAVYEYQQKLKQYEVSKSRKEQEELKNELKELKTQITEEKKLKEQEEKYKQSRNKFLGDLQKAGAEPEVSAKAYDLFVKNYYNLSAEDIIDMTQYYHNRAQENQKKQMEERFEKKNPPPPPPSSNGGGHVDSLSSEEKWKKRFKK